MGAHQPARSPAEVSRGEPRREVSRDGARRIAMAWQVGLGKQTGYMRRPVGQSSQPADEISHGTAAALRAGTYGYSSRETGE